MPRYRIVLAQPNAELMRIFSDYLKRSELEVIGSEDTAGTLEACRRFRPDLVAAESHLAGGESGVNLVQAIRSESALEGLPFLLLSETITPEERLGALNAGADDYLLKPFSMRELLYRCERLAQLRRRTDPGELSGDLARFKSTDILQMLEANQATGVLHIEGDHQGEIHLLDGYVCGGFAAGATGEEAAYRLIPVRNGRFHFVRSDIRSNIETVRSTTELMMEALRRHDEGAKVPGAKTKAPRLPSSA